MPLGPDHVRPEILASATLPSHARRGKSHNLLTCSCRARCRRYSTQVNVVAGVRDAALIAVLAVMSAAMPAQDAVEAVVNELAEQFEAGSVAVDGVKYGYRLLRPLPRHADRERPLVVFLHGAGERGDDNRRQLYWLPRTLASEPLRSAEPCFVLAVQCGRDERWVDTAWGNLQSTPIAAAPTRPMRAVQQALRQVLAEPGIDHARVYLTGLSMGGYGTWDLLAREPDLFAAALPICGGGDPATAATFAAVPIEVWHGAADAVVPSLRSRGMVQALLECGAVVRYHELADVGHDVWRQAYGEGGALDWLFAQDQRQQRRGMAAEPAIVPRPELLTRLPGRFTLLLGSRCIVDEPLRAVAQAVVDRLELPAVRRPGIVSGIEPIDGDIVICVDTTLGQGFDLQIGTRIELRVGEQAAWRGGAALLQALRTWPSGIAPCALVRQRQAAAVGRVVLAGGDDGGPGAAAWTREAVAQLLELCWLANVQELVVLDAGQRSTLANFAADGLPTAQDLGLRVIAADGLTAASRVADPGARVTDVLTSPEVSASTPFELRIAPASPAEQLQRIGRLLPAMAERAARNGGPVHVGSYLVRQAAQARHRVGR